MTNAVSLAQQASTGVSPGFRNRIINGGMTIDQRNAGASVTPSTGFRYNLDRWTSYASQTSKFTVQQDAGAVTPPTGFSDYLGVTSLSAYSVIGSDLFMISQAIEGFNTADLAWGTANAKTVTLSFWVRSSLTGTFGGALLNSTNNRSYPYSYTISSANTWEQKSITIAGDTTGTWVGATNGIGMYVSFSFGMGSAYSGTAGAWSGSQLWSATGATSVVGTNGATFYITGVQLEVGSTATSFDYRPYGTELQLCERYFQKLGNSSYVGIANGNATGNSNANFILRPTVDMRASPTVSYATLIVTDRGFFDKVVTSISTVIASPTGIYMFTTCSGAGTMSYGDAVGLAVESTTSGFLSLSAEL